MAERRRERRYALWATAAVVAALVGALLLRFYFVEPRAVGFACQAAEAPWWCDLRLAVVMTFQQGGIGWLSALLGMLALFNRSRGAAVAAMMAGVAGLTLYNPETGAVGFILGLLSALRRPPAPERSGAVSG